MREMEDIEKNKGVSDESKVIACSRGKNDVERAISLPRDLMSGVQLRPIGLAPDRRIASA